MSERLMGVARAVADRLSPDEGMRALFVAGSLGAGTADAWSDLDLVVVAEPARHGAAAATFAEAVGAVSPLVMRRERLGRTSLVYLVTERWDLCDLFLAGVDDSLLRSAAGTGCTRSSIGTGCTPACRRPCRPRRPTRSA